MKDLRYILIDYGRYKDLEGISRWKDFNKEHPIKSMLFAGAMILFLVFYIRTWWFQDVQGLLYTMGAFILFLLIFLFPVFLEQEKKFSMFGLAPRLKMLFSKKTAKEIIKDSNEYREKNKVENKYLSDKVPEWFESFLDEKGIDEKNIDLLIDELKEKYDYPIMKKVLGIIGFIVAFIGWNGFIEITWTIERIVLVVVVFVAFMVGIIVIEEYHKSKKTDVHPVVFMKGKKEEFLRDLNLMKIEWASRKQ